MPTLPSVVVDAPSVVGDKVVDWRHRIWRSSNRWEYGREVDLELVSVDISVCITLSLCLPSSSLFLRSRAALTHRLFGGWLRGWDYMPFRPPTLPRPSPPSGGGVANQLEKPGAQILDGLK